MLLPGVGFEALGVGRVQPALLCGSKTCVQGAGEGPFTHHLLVGDRPAGLP